MDYLRALALSLRALLLASLAGSIEPARAQSDPEVLLWDEVRLLGTPEAFQRYLDAYPVGRHAAEAFRCLVAGSLATAGPRPCSPGNFPPPGEPIIQSTGAVTDLY